MKNFFKKKINENYFFRKLYLIYKYYFLTKKKLKYQLFDENIKYQTQNNNTIIFTLIETSHPINFLLMLLAKILQIRGYKVFILVCDKFLGACEIKSIKNKKDKNPCFNCKFNQEKVFPLFKIPIIRLSSLNNKKINVLVSEGVKRFKINGYNFKNKDKYYHLNIHIKDSVTRYFYGNLYKEEFKKNIKETSINHCRTAVYMQEISKILDQKYKPKAVVSTMSVYSTWYPIFNFFNKKGRFKQFSLTQFNLKALTFNEFELYPAYTRFKKFLITRKFKSLTKKENIKFSKFVNQRFQGSARIFVNDNYFGKKKKRIEEIRNLLKINKKKKNIFLFSNVFWDVGLADRSLVFKSVQDWLFYTIDLLKNDSNYHIYIKPHPGEFKSSESLIGIENIIKTKYENLPSNITFIKADYQIKPYDLKPFIDLALVFNGTLNIEFMIQKVPVVSCGISPTLGLGLSKDISSKYEYEKIFTNKNYDYSKFLVRDVKKLNLFAYFYFIKNSIPWNYTSSVWGENFKKFNFKSLSNLNKNNSMLDHIIKCIVNEDEIVPENW